MKKNIDGSKTAGQEMKEKQSSMDKAVNLAKEEQYLSEAEEKQIRNRRDGSEKRAGKSSM
jgi:hypothetical protein